MVVDKEAYQSRWEDNFWGKGLEQGVAFDASGSSPALVHLLSKRQPNLATTSTTTVLVPGCGRGYDLLTFMKHCNISQAVGLEISPSAVATASAYIQANAASPEDAAKMKVVEGDFFKWSPESMGGKFDIGYDYTFFCAMHPDMRADTARAWARLLKSGGVLVTLEFPLHGGYPDPSKTEGPPWPVSHEDYRKVLEPAGFKLEERYEVPAELSHSGRGGREAMAVWRLQ